MREAHIAESLGHRPAANRCLYPAFSHNGPAYTVGSDDEDLINASPVDRERAAA